MKPVSKTQLVRVDRAFAKHLAERAERGQTTIVDVTRKWARALRAKKVRTA